MQIGSLPAVPLRGSPIPALHALWEGLMNGRVLGTLHERGITPQGLRSAAVDVWQGKPMITGKMTDAGVRAALKSVRPVAPYSRLYQWLADEVEAMTAGVGTLLREVSHVAWLDGEGKIGFSYPKRLSRLKEDMPVLVIDAQANPAILDNVFLGRTPRYRRWDAPRHAEIIQVTDHAYAKSRFADPALIERIERFATDQGPKVVLFTQKAMRCQLTGEKPDTGTLPCPTILPSGGAVANYGQLTGRNNFSDYDTAVVVGRQEMPARAAESYRGLYWSDPKVLNLPGEYVRQIRGDATGRGVNVSVHPDPRLQAVVEQRREWGVVQAIDRLRLLSPDRESATIFVFCNIPLPIAPTAWVTEGELLPPEWCELARAAGGAVLGEPGFLLATFPDRFPNPQAASDWLRWGGAVLNVRDSSAPQIWRSLRSKRAGLGGNSQTGDEGAVVHYRAKPKRARGRAMAIRRGATYGHPLAAPEAVARAAGHSVDVVTPLGEGTVTLTQTPEGVTTTTEFWLVTATGNQAYGYIGHPLREADRQGHEQSLAAVPTTAEEKREIWQAAMLLLVNTPRSLEAADLVESPSRATESI